MMVDDGVASPGPLLFSPNAILSSAALESHRVACDRVLTIAEREGERERAVGTLGH